VAANVIELDGSSQSNDNKAGAQERIYSYMNRGKSPDIVPAPLSQPDKKEGQNKRVNKQMTKPQPRPTPAPQTKTAAKTLPQKPMKKVVPKPKVTTTASTFDPPQDLITLSAGRSLRHRPITGL